MKTLYSWLHWPEKHPHIWRAYQMITLLLDFLAVLQSIWKHDIGAASCFCGLLAFTLLLIHHKFSDDGPDDDQDGDDNPDSPTGDAIDLWLRNRTRIKV